MKLKTAFTLLLFLSICLLPGHAAVQDRHDELFTIAEFDHDETSAMYSVIKPIRAFKNSSEIYVIFNFDLGAMDVIISKDGQAVYNSRVEVTPAEHTIDIRGYEPGEYLIEFFNNKGERIYCEFRID